jgi:Ca2+-binding RTX toxin-like protein
MPTIVGTGADDSLRGGLEDDLLQGFGGQDTLRGGQGRDTLDGGAGDDDLFDNDAGRYIGGEGDDYINVSLGNVTGIHEIVEDGGEGNDLLYARAGSPFQSSAGTTTATLIGGDGSDSITASGSLSATMVAGAGDDLVSVTGQFFRGAIVTLGSGADRLRWDVNSGDSVTIVTDFQPGDGGDRLTIDLTYQISNWDGATNPFASGHFRLSQQGGDTVLQRDADGPSGAAQFADIVRFQNTSSSQFTAFNLFDFSPSGAAPPGGVLTGTDAPDDLRGTSGPDLIRGLGGGDALQGFLGSDTLDGGEGDDLLQGGAGDDSLSGGAGADDLVADDGWSAAGANTLSGGEGNDLLTGGDGNDRLSGDDGADRLLDGKGDDLLLGGGGADYISSGSGADTLDGGDGDDWLQTGSGADLLSGGAGRDSFAILGIHTSLISAEVDRILDWSAEDRLRFLDNAGHDTSGPYAELTAPDLMTAASLAASSGAYFVAAQVGADVIVFAGQNEAVRLVGRSLADISETSVQGAYVSRSGVSAGTGGADNVQLSAGADTFSAGGGADTVVGMGGDDSIASGDGDDRVFGSGGADTVVDTGGSNFVQGGEGGDSIVGGAGFDDINGNQGDDTCVSGGGDDWVVGGKDNDSLSGSAGHNIVYGNLGADTCEGGEGNDIVRGGQQNDVVSGGAGDDYVSGDKGDDTVTGGTGADLFHTFGDAGIDRVTDFTVAEGDRVLLDPGTQYTVTQVGSDTVISMTGGGQMILVGVQLASLPAGWIFGA